MLINLTPHAIDFTDGIAPSIPPSGHMLRLDITTTPVVVEGVSAPVMKRRETLRLSEEVLDLLNNAHGVIVSAQVATHLSSIDEFNAGAVAEHGGGVCTAYRDNPMPPHVEVFTVGETVRGEDGAIRTKYLVLN